MPSSLSQKTARLCAVEILQEVMRNKKAVKPIFDSHVAKAQLPPKERNLAKELIYGTLRRKEELDNALASLSNTPLKKIDPFLYQILITGIYQILFLERIPDSAAVNEAVIICKTHKKPFIPKRLHGFVNGVLRQTARKKEELLRDLARRQENSSTLIYNHPQWIIKRWQQRFGQKETARICATNNRQPLLILRVNSQKQSRTIFCEKLDSAEICYQKGHFAPDAVILPEGADITKIPGYDAGEFQVQDQAAQLASLLLAPFDCANLRVLDGCAGVGGKTSHLLQLVRPDATMHAVEPEPFRMARLQEIQQRQGTAKLHLHLAALSTFLPPSLFDRILIDAPCSGTGVLRRNPDIRWTRELQDIVFFQEKQLALLHHAASFAAPGAVLVYATCSLEEEENEEVVTKFLQLHPEFALSDPVPFLPEAAHKFVHNNFFSPHPEEEIDGFFSARLKRREK